MFFCVNLQCNVLQTYIWQLPCKFVPTLPFSLSFMKLYLSYSKVRGQPLYTHFSIIFFFYLDICSTVYCNKATKIALLTRNGTQFWLHACTTLLGKVFKSIKQKI